MAPSAFRYTLPSGAVLDVPLEVEAAGPDALVAYVMSHLADESTAESTAGQPSQEPHDPTA